MFALYSAVLFVKCSVLTAYCGPRVFSLKSCFGSNLTTQVILIPDLSFTYFQASKTSGLHIFSLYSAGLYVKFFQSTTLEVITRKKNKTSPVSAFRNYVSFVINLNR